MPSKEHESTSSGETGHDDIPTSDPDERDEVKEVRKLAEKETKRIRIWRILVSAVLLTTAIAVTVSTFAALEREEQDRFRRAFDQFSVTIAGSALDQQANIRMALHGVADVISSGAFVSNSTWPFYTFPRFEQLAYNAIFQSKIEILTVCHHVKESERDEWIRYAWDSYESWMDEGYAIRAQRDGPGVYNNYRREGYHPFITKSSLDGYVQVEEKTDYWPAWTYSPTPHTFRFINWDFTDAEDYDAIIRASHTLKQETLFTRVRSYVSANGAFTEEEHAAKHSPLFAHVLSQLPHSFVFHAIRKDPDANDSDIVAMVVGGMAWDAALLGLLPKNANGIFVVIKNTCGQSYTFLINGPDATFMGEGDHHDRKYDYMEKIVQLTQYDDPNFREVDGHCIYSMNMYPNKSFEETWNTNEAERQAVIIACTFLLVIMVFFIYDVLVQRRNEKLVVNAAKTSAIVSSLFPSNIRDKLIEHDGKTANLKSFMSDNNKLHGTNQMSSSAPLADLFLETTIMFADIVGFTAWSSTREPSQVFILLETLYSAFDALAKARRVFKVETVGDCYVAAAGMPEPRKDHAVIMCRFAREILRKTTQLTKELEVSLGPDTCELVLRIGIHSGPVTAGVLRGEKARFQLFGDTMNMTSRIESNSLPGLIHLSAETAMILINGGKGHWVEKRHEMIEAKGKGFIQTYWLTAASHGQSSSHSSNESSSRMSDDTPAAQEDVQEEKVRRLIDWNVESLLRGIKLIVAFRAARNCRRSGASDRDITNMEHETLYGRLTFLEEVKEIVTLPEFNTTLRNDIRCPDEVELPPEIAEQLRDYVTCIASMYRANKFHNFEHASHVTLSVLKLLSRIVAPTVEEVSGASMAEHAATLHDYTYGITSDPLTHFACAFAALIHDVDHCGVPNAQLVKEMTPIAIAYNNRSVAEQNSLAIAWDLLMDERFKCLRRIIYIDAEELGRFRQLVVNAVMATDIVDKELKTLRNKRWEAAFATGECAVSNTRDTINRKATIVIEHLIQASDVAHTMQHWHVYRKWNERFFRECYEAYIHGRAEKDPSVGWYEGELGFFDFYIIPLARKLKDCGVFGKSSDEYLNYATKNRQEWEARGAEFVAEMKTTMMSELGDMPHKPAILE